MPIKRIATERQQTVDLTELYYNLLDKYRNVFMMQLENQVYIYRSIGRKTYKDILTKDGLTDLQKEEIICRECLLYPDPELFDWENCDAGIPTQLRKSILKNSYLESIEDQNLLRTYYRNEMWDLDNQITCIINEAFPNIDIEEIEQWDVEKTTKYLTRAEWKLHNLRGLKFVDPQGEYTTVQSKNANTKQVKQKKTKTIRGTNKEDKLTPDLIHNGPRKKAPLEKDKSGMSYEEFVQKFPEFANDSILSEGMGAFEGKETISPALRVGY